MKIAFRCSAADGRCTKNATKMPTVSPQRPIAATASPIDVASRPFTNAATTAARPKTSIGEAAAAIGLAGLTVGVFVAFFVQRPSAALERNAIFMPWVSIVLTTFWTRMLYLDDPETLDAKLGKAAKDASEELSAIAMRYAVIDGKELTVAKEAARTRPTVPKI